MAEICEAITLKVEVPPPIILTVDFKGEFLSSSDGEDYKRGYEEGHAQGLIDGRADGYESGYQEGHKVGSETGYQTGKNEGLTEGYGNGYKQGKADGYKDGYEKGYEQGYDKGLTDGTKEEQEKLITITENGTTEITPDDNKVLSKVEVVVDVEAEGGLPDWDDDSPIIASGKSYFTSNVVWELTEKGTFRWKIVNLNDTTSNGLNASVASSLALSVIPLDYLEICNKIKQIYVPDGAKDTQFLYAINCERIRVPKTLISAPAYTGMTSLREIDASDEIYTTISQYGFANMARLEKITLCAKITTITRSAFEKCYSLKEINLDNITKFEQNCLYEDYSFDKDVVFSADLVDIYNTAFARTSIKSITFQQPTGDFPTIANTAFSQCRDLTDIYCPWSEGEVANAPWGATNATIHYNSGV